MVSYVWYGLSYGSLVYTYISEGHLTLNIGLVIFKNDEKNI